ncbi:MAG: Fe-S cluster assembly protein SufD [Verrucomicrobiota bacterium]
MFKQAPAEGSERFHALHQASSACGLFVYVPRGVTIDIPIEVIHFIDGESAAIFPHSLIIAEGRGSVSVVETIASAGEQAGLSCGLVDLIARDQGRIQHVLSQELNPHSHCFQMGSTTVGKDANVGSWQLHLGSEWTRTEHVSHLIESGANSDMFSVAVTSANQEVDQRTLQHHGSAHTTSDLLYKNVLLDRARTIFAGLIQVDDDAHYTDAYQTSRNLLLSDEAEANAMPGLEINADQVKCSHGATTGQLDADQIFYLKARGIPEKEARLLITMGFCAEVIDKVSGTPLEEWMRAKVYGKFDRLKD